MMKSNGRKKSWGKMSARELAQATKEFDHPLPASRYKPVTPAEWARYQRALRAGRSRRLGPLALDPKLLAAACAYAKRKKISLAQMFERGLRREMAVQ
jgi:hypothetical protein